MKTLIVSYSHTNNNRLLARHIRQRMDSDMLEIEDLGKRTNFSILLDMLFNRTASIKYSPKQIADYDMVIITAPIWAGRIASPMRTFLQREKANIKRYAFITMCGGATGEQAQKISQELHRIFRKAPVAACELHITDILPLEKRKAKYTMSFRATDEDIVGFESKISGFIRQIEAFPELLQTAPAV